MCLTLILFCIKLPIGSQSIFGTSVTFECLFTLFQLFDTLVSSQAYYRDKKRFVILAHALK